MKQRQLRHAQAVLKFMFKILRSRRHEHAWVEHGQRGHSMGNMDSDSHGAPVHQRRTCHRRGFEQLHLRQDFGSWCPLPETEVPRTVWYSCVLHLDAFKII